MGGKGAKPKPRSVEGKIPLPVKSYKQEVRILIITILKSLQKQKME
jgi:hypothetical protein